MENNDELILQQYENLLKKMISKLLPSKYYSLLYEDCMQEARIAVFEAIEKYDSNKSNNFSNYACLVVRSRLQEFLARNQYSARLPVNVWRDFRKYQKELMTGEILLEPVARGKCFDLQKLIRPIDIEKLL